MDLIRLLASPRYTLIDGADTCAELKIAAVVDARDDGSLVTEDVAARCVFDMKAARIERCAMISAFDDIAF